MHPGKYAKLHADRPAFIMASTGEAITHGELERRSNRLAHLLRAQGTGLGSGLNTHRFVMPDLIRHPWFAGAATPEPIRGRSDRAKAMSIET